jgi:signal transduction histidine kinase
MKWPTFPNPGFSPLETAARNRAYRIRVLLLGVLGIGLMGGFAVLVQAGLRSEAKEAAREEVERRLLALRARLESLYHAEFPPLERVFMGRRITDRIFWERIGAGLDVNFLELLGGLALRVVGPSGKDLWSVGESRFLDGPEDWTSGSDIWVGEQVGATVTGAISLPARSLPQEAVRLGVCFDLSLNLAEHERITRFVLLGTLLLGLTLYVLFAAWELFNRRQAAFLRKEEERATRLRAMADIAGGIAHEVRNPINSIGLTLQYLERVQVESLPPNAKEGYDRIQNELGRIRRVVDHFSRFARISDLQLAPVELVSLIEAVCAYPGGPRELGELLVTLRLPPALRLIGDREKLDEALRSILSVFRWRARNQGPVPVTIEAAEKDGHIHVTFEDENPIGEEEVARWAEGGGQHPSRSAEFTMVMARSFVESHRGRLRITQAPGGGLRIQIELPIK